MVIFHSYVSLPEGKSYLYPFMQSLIPEIWDTRWFDHLRPNQKTRVLWGVLIWLTVHIWLVVWNMALIFYNIWDNPSHWLSYFSRWLKPPTGYWLQLYNQWLVVSNGLVWIKTHRIEANTCRTQRFLFVGKTQGLLWGTWQVEMPS